MLLKPSVLASLVLLASGCRTAGSAGLKDEGGDDPCAAALTNVARDIPEDLTNIPRRDTTMFYAKMARDLSYEQGAKLRENAAAMGIEILVSGDGAEEKTYQSWFVGRSKNYFVWGVQGTANWTNLGTDLSLVSLSGPTLLNDKIANGALHGGFYWSADQHYAKIAGCLATLRKNNPDTPIAGVGHSLGGATAELVREALVFKDPSLAQKNFLVTFGKPRTGTSSAVAAYQQAANETRHYFHNTDMVAHVPPKSAFIATDANLIFAESPNKFLLREPLAKVELKGLRGEDLILESGRQEMTLIEKTFYEAFGTAFEIRRAIRTAVGSRGHYMVSYVNTLEKIGRENISDELPILSEITQLIEVRQESERISRLAQELNARSEGARKYGSDCINLVRKASWTGVWRPNYDCNRCCQATYARHDGGYGFCTEEWKICILACAEGYGNNDPRFFYNNSSVVDYRKSQCAAP